MRLTVFGATGGTGTEVTRQALEAGHQVTAVVRDPARLAVPPSERLAVAPADVTDPESIIETLEGADAAVSALGRRRGGPATIRADGIRAILSAMEKAGARRLVAISASGMFGEPGEPPLTRHALKPLLRLLLRSAAADIRRMEELIAFSALDWTIMRPSRLLNTPRRPYRTALDRYAGPQIGRADLADAILRALGDPATVAHRVNVAY
ncbi:MAG: NAD(P)H-binding protein [Nocardiopsaceae bacterium]|nr:NAD(P)H-binding protein [Nocardiopsaceae bacterium]